MAVSCPRLCPAARGFAAQAASERDDLSPSRRTERGAVRKLGGPDFPESEASFRDARPDLGGTQVCWSISIPGEGASATRFEVVKALPAA
jgi:hypothetical protein